MEFLFTVSGRQERNLTLTLCVEQGSEILEWLQTLMPLVPGRLVSEVSQVKDNGEWSGLQWTGEHVTQLKWAAAVYLHGQLPWGNVNSVCHSSNFSRENVNLVGFFGKIF